MTSNHFVSTKVLYTCSALLTTTLLLAACNPSGGGGNQDASKLSISFQQTKVFHFDWDPVAGADSYQLLESLSGRPGTEVSILEDMPASATHAELEVPLFASTQAHYFIQSCDDSQGFCEDFAEVQVTADDLDELTRSIGYIKAPDPVEVFYDYNFGYAVAISGDGDTLAVGAVEGAANDTSEQMPGVVYIYTDSGTGSWKFQQSIYSDSPDSDSDFGSALSLTHDGNRLIIGAPSDEKDDEKISIGAGYIYERDGNNTWQFIKRLSLEENSNENSHFGSSVSISSDGSVVAIGAPGVNGDNHNEENNEEAFGAVYSFRAADDWNSPETLRSNTPGTAANFGAAVSLNHNGTVLAAGEPKATIKKDETEFFEAGAAYVFTRTTNNDTWTSPGKVIVALLPGEENDFGSYLSLSANGTTLAVGVPYDGSAGRTVYNLLETPQSDLPANDGATARTSGAAYVFRNEGGFWGPWAYIKASNAAEDDYFGTSISLNEDGTILAVGAPLQNDLVTGINAEQILDRGDDNDVGAAYTFALSDRFWSQQSYLKASNANAGAEFGNAIAISADGRTLAVAASAEDNGASGVNGALVDGNIRDSGAVYLY